MTKPHSADAHHADVATTLRNALKLGGSLLLTLVIGFGTRIALRRYLGPAVIGPVNFADAFTTTAFVFVGLGIDTHVRKIVPVTLEGANAFIGTIFLVRLLLSAMVFGAMGVVLTWMGQPDSVRTLVWAYGAAQLVMSFNYTLAALLQSARTVDGLSVLNVVSKLMWAAGFVATMVFQWPLVGIPLSVLAAELVKLIGGFVLARRHVKLKLELHWATLWPTLRASFAFYMNGVALVVVSRFDVNVLKVATVDAEVGLYSAASEIAQITLVMTPMMTGVVMPLFARTQARSPDEFYAIVRRTVELVLVLAAPVSLMLSLGADVWVQLLLGEQYAPAAWALSILSPSLLLTYIAVIIATALNMNDQGWTVTLTSTMSMFVNPIAVLSFVALSKSLGWGEGGGGAACALAAVTTESLVVTVMFWRFGRVALDARLIKVLLKTAAVGAVVFAIDRSFLQPLGPARLVLDGLLYLGLVLGTGAVSVQDTLAFVRQVRSARQQQPVVAAT
ncbi:MAG: oligosaccharide flippase family protein [Myxococcota bacterium]